MHPSTREDDNRSTAHLQIENKSPGGQQSCVDETASRAVLNGSNASKIPDALREPFYKEDLLNVRKTTNFFRQLTNHLIDFIKGLAKSWHFVRPVTQEVAEDIVGDVLRDLIQKKWEGGNLTIFARTIIYNKLVDYYKKNPKGLTKYVEDVDDGSTDEDEVQEKEAKMEKERALDAALKQLPPKIRRLMELRYQEKKSYSEIARELSMGNGNNARVQHHNAKNKLAALLGKFKNKKR